MRTRAPSQLMRSAPDNVRRKGDDSIFASLSVLAGALLLGAAHAFEPDHMSAVSAFVARRPAPREAAAFGVRWALGHGLSLLLLGSAVWAFQWTLSESLAGSLEKLVGVALLGLGLWTLWRLRPGDWHHTHSHSHAEGATPAPIESSASAHLDGATHTHADGTTHSHGAHSHADGSLWMGLLHGAAGTAGFVVLASVAFTSGYFMVLAYTLAFSLGVLLAMGAYAGLLGGIINRGGRRSRLVAKAAQAVAGLAACVVGACWIAGIEIPWLHFPTENLH